MSGRGELRLERDGHVAKLIISNPRRRNAMSRLMWQALADMLAELRGAAEVRVLLLQGALLVAGGREPAINDPEPAGGHGESGTGKRALPTGERGNSRLAAAAFCAGADIGELPALVDDPRAARENAALIAHAQLALETFPKPTVAMIEGACFGGGFGLALACDLRFAAPTARFAVTPAKLGLVYGLPDTRRLLRTLGPTLTRDLLLTARVMTASEALERGVVTALEPAASLAARALDTAHALARGSASALSGIKRTLNHLEGVGEDSAADIERLFGESFASADAREGAAAFLDKRRPQFNRSGSEPESGSDAGESHDPTPD